MNPAAVSTAKSQVCLKRLLDEPSEGLPKFKQARLATQPPAIGIPPCLRPSGPAAPKSSLGQLPSRVGRYLLLERCEGEETYKAEHVHTKQQYTCQVALPQITPLYVCMYVLYYLYVCVTYMYMYV